MRRTAVAIVATMALAPCAQSAVASFVAGVQADGAQLAAYVVPTPTGIRCTGLSSLLTSKIAWDAVAPPAGQSIDYVVAKPGGDTVETSATTYTLPPVTLLPGQYAVRARIAAGWVSQPATITVTLGALGLLYLCRAP